MRRPDATSAPLLLGLEAGGTRTTARAAFASGEVVAERVFGPGNLRLLDDAALVRLFREVAAALPIPAAIGLGMAGLRTDADRARALRALDEAWPGTPARVAHDLEAALWAADRPRTKRAPTARVLVLSGTGSCCYGTGAAGDRTAKVGGWGHILGDKGSGYDIALRALKAVVYYLDRDGRWSRLGERLLGAAGLNSPEELVGWVQAADKAAVAALAPQVFAAWAERDRIAADILAAAAAGLAKDAVACARQLAKPGPGPGPVDFVLAGGVLLGQPRFAARVARHLRTLWRGAVIVRPLTVPGVAGAVRMALEASTQGGREAVLQGGEKRRPGGAKRPAPPSLADVHRSPTEQRNPRSLHLDRLPLDAAIELMLDEEAGVAAALRREQKPIGRALRLIIRRLKAGGRLFYAGAGTSGRLGILDASECPPTFRTPPELVQAIMAGGRDAVFRAVEGAEDDAEAGAAAVRFRGVRPDDVLVGIAASGRTPFVWGALEAARAQGTATVLLCFNPHVALPRGRRPDVVIAADLGPEVLTGSTRLKAGTATKLVLNLFSTLAMVRLGKVVSNLMVDVNPSNVKLRDRAVRIVRELTGADEAAARAALEAEGWVVKAAWRRLSRGRRRAR